MVNRKKIAALALACAAAVIYTPGNAWAGEQGVDGVRISNEKLKDSEAECQPGWNKTADGWYWQDTDGRLHKGWLSYEGRTYYMNEDGLMAVGWREVEGDWYYFHQDGGMNLGELILDNSCYEFSGNGSLVSASWVRDSGGGAYHAGCYDEAAQNLFDQLNEEKKQQYFDAFPDREDGYDGDMHRQYDRYAGFEMSMDLNKEASHRLDQAIRSGYMKDLIPGEGTLSDYLMGISSPYRSRSLLELYIRGCDDSREAFDKVMTLTDKRYDSKQDRKYTLEYYRQLGMAHSEKDGKQYFMLILMR